MIKKILTYSLGSILLLAACKKAENLTGPLNTSLAYVSITNANASKDTVNVFSNNDTLTLASAIAPNGTVLGLYTGVTPGNHLIEARDYKPANTIYYEGDIDVIAGNSYALVFYDTLKAGRFKAILLNNERKADANPLNAKVRFLNLSPKSPAFDFWMVRRVGAVPKDSVKLYSVVPNLGSVATPDAAALSVYSSVLANQAANAAGPGIPVSDYILRLKLANTNTIVFSSAATTIVPGRNYTFFARGIYPSIGITSVFNN